MITRILVPIDFSPLEDAALRHLHDRLSLDDREHLGAVAALEKSDEPAKEIVQYAREAGIDLIVMGTHGRSGLPHVLVGSVAERVVRLASCPVLTTRDGHVAADRTGDGHVHSHTRSHGFQRAV